MRSVCTESAATSGIGSLLGICRPLADVDVEVRVGVAVDAGDVGEEDRVELRGLESLREVDPDPHVVELDLPGVGPAPLAVVDVRVRVHHEGVEVQWGGHVVLLGSKAGMEAISCRVYGCCGRLKMSSGTPSSTTRPSFMTMTRWLRWLMTPRSCEMKR